MAEGGKFNIDNQLKPTNKDINVVFSPSANITKYSYTTYKNGKQENTVSINNQKDSKIIFSDTGNYQITVKSYDNLGKEYTLHSGLYIVDKEAPVINVSKTHIETFKDHEFKDKIKVTAKDNHDGDLTTNVKSSEIDLSKTGTQKLTYTVVDTAGNVGEKVVNVNVTGNVINVLFLEIAMLILVVLVTIPIMKMWKSFKLDKRIDPFVIRGFRENNISAFDRVYNFYHKLINKIMKLFKGSNFVPKYAKKLDKYVSVNSLHSSGMEIFAGKVLLSIVFVMIACLWAAMRFEMITAFEIIIPLIIGFFVFDVVYFIKYKFFKSKLENDFLSAIIIMNNAFKSGRSITQAIDLVGTEMDGVISKEFKKMSLELSYGLGIDVIFKRFAERIKLEEVNYLTASLTILNKTGGNIIEVFSAIEKTLFNKKKLRLELKSLTGSSKIIVYVLFAVPFFFILFVSLINPTYFMPFIENDLGRILMVFMIVYYVIFVICVRKIMKVVI